MAETNTVVAVFPDHEAAESAVKNLAGAGFDIKHLSVIGKGYHTDEKVEGFYNAGDRVKFWGSRGAYWGALWGWLIGALFITIPGAGGVVVLGYFRRYRAFDYRRRRCRRRAQRLGRSAL